MAFGAAGMMWLVENVPVDTTLFTSNCDQKQSGNVLTCLYTSDCEFQEPNDSLRDNKKDTLNVDVHWNFYLVYVICVMKHESGKNKYLDLKLIDINSWDEEKVQSC